MIRYVEIPAIYLTLSSQIPDDGIKYYGDSIWRKAPGKITYYKSIWRLESKLSIRHGASVRFSTNWASQRHEIRRELAFGAS